MTQRDAEDPERPRGTDETVPNSFSLLGRAVLPPFPDGPLPSAERSEIVLQGAPLSGGSSARVLRVRLSLAFVVVVLMAITWLTRNCGELTVN